MLAEVHGRNREVHLVHECWLKSQVGVRHVRGLGDLREKAAGRKDDDDRCLAELAAGCGRTPVVICGAAVLDADPQKIHWVSEVLAESDRALEIDQCRDSC